MTEPLSWREICGRYPNQWVTLAQIDWIEDRFELRSAIVLASGPTRAEAVRRARPLLDSCAEFGCFSTGRASARPHRTVALA